MIRKLARFTKILVFLGIIGFIGFGFNLAVYHFPLYIPTPNELSADVKGVRNVIARASQNNTVLSARTEEPQITPLVTKYEEITYGFPVKIRIPKLGIDLNIENGTHDFSKTSWDIKNGLAYFAELSDLPSNLNGNTIIYAENTEEAFGKTLDIYDGDVIELELQNGTIFKYNYLEDQYRNPGATDMFKIKDAPRVTILTKHGENNERYRLIYGILSEVISVDEGP